MAPDTASAFVISLLHLIATTFFSLFSKFSSFFFGYTFKVALFSAVHYFFSSFNLA
jgi:hypothetical protein